MCCPVDVVLQNQRVSLPCCPAMLTVRFPFPIQEVSLTPSWKLVVTDTKLCHEGLGWFHPHERVLALVLRCTNTVLKPTLLGKRRTCYAAVSQSAELVDQAACCVPRKYVPSSQDLVGCSLVIHHAGLTDCCTSNSTHCCCPDGCLKYVAPSPTLLF